MTIGPVVENSDEDDQQSKDQLAGWIHGRSRPDRSSVRLRNEVWYMKPDAVDMPHWQSLNFQFLTLGRYGPTPTMDCDPSRSSLSA